MKPLHLDCSCMSAGAGDVLAALWAVFAAKREGWTVKFHVPESVRNVAAMFLAEEELGEGKRQAVEFFLPWQATNRATAAGMSRTRFYWSKLPEAARGSGPCKPVILQWERNEDFAGKVLLFPVANYLERMWPSHQWKALERLLTAQGLDVVFCTDETTRAAALIGGLAPLVKLPNWQTVAAAMNAAQAVVCNDSGPLHMAAALGVPNVAIFAQMPRSFCGDYAETVPVVPEWQGTCAGCNFQREKGARQGACAGACHELWSISPRSVAGAVCQTIGKPC
jgi:hypothetical protein